MRRSARFLAFAFLAMPAVLLAQQAQPRSTDAAPVEAGSAAAPSVAPTAAPKSLMGMVMGALIESAEQAAKRQSDLQKAPATAPDAPALQAGPVSEPPAQVAVQSTGDGAP